MSPLWRCLEWFPKRDRYKEWVKRATLLGYYIPDAEPRSIPTGSFIHESVVSRMLTVPDYRPVNLPENYSVVQFNTVPNGGV